MRGPRCYLIEDAQLVLVPAEVQTLGDLLARGSYAIHHGDSKTDWTVFGWPDAKEYQRRLDVWFQADGHNDWQRASDFRAEQLDRFLLSEPEEEG